MLKDYNIFFSYEDNNFEKRYFKVENIQAESRQKAFDAAIIKFNQSITLVRASENGKQYYSQF